MKHMKHVMFRNDKRIGSPDIRCIQRCKYAVPKKAWGEAYSDRNLGMLTTLAHLRLHCSCADRSPEIISM